MAEAAARAVVSDDGSTIWLTAYTATGEAVPVALQPARAAALAGELIERAMVINERRGNRSGSSRNGLYAPSDPAVTTERSAGRGGRKVARSPGAAFTLTRQLIRGASRATTVEQAYRAAVLDTVRAAER